MEKLLALLKRLGAKDEEIDAAKAEIEAEKESEVEGLKAKNKELIEKSKKAKEGEGGKVAELEAKIDELSESLAKEKKAGEIAVKKLTTERDTLAKSLSETSTKAREYQTDVTLREALGKLGVGKRNALDMEDAINFLKSKLVYETVDGQEQTFVNYEEVAKAADGKETRTATKKALGEYLEKVYPSTDHAKRFIPAGDNRGIGAGGPKATITPTGDQQQTVRGVLSAALA